MLPMLLMFRFGKEIVTTIFERTAIAERSYKRPGHTVIHKCSTKTGYVDHVTLCYSL